MYAIHFILFVTALVLCHIIHSCLKPFMKNQEIGQEAEESSEKQTNAEPEDESCRWAMWSAWSECTVTCGDGVSVRHRIILILDNCTGDLVQEKVCSERHCPYDKDFIIQRKDEDYDQSADGTDSQLKSESGKGHQHDQHGKGDKAPDVDSPDEHVTGHSNVHHADFDSDNDARRNDPPPPPNSRTRGRQSWTSDDGKTWDHQSSFESLSHGEEADLCLSDCSPTDRPAKEFGSEETFEKGDKTEAGDSGQDKDHGSFEEDGRKDDYAKDQSYEKDDDARFQEKDNHVNEESLKDDDEHSNNEGNQYDAESDFENDDDYDNAEDDDDAYDDDDDAGGDDEDNENESNKKQKQEYDEEEDADQDDLEQDEVEGTKGKSHRRKKKRKRKRKPKKIKQNIGETNSQNTCDPTEICDTFMANTESFSSTKTQASAESGNEIHVSTNVMSVTSESNDTTKGSFT